MRPSNRRLENLDCTHRAFAGADIRPGLGGNLDSFGGDDTPAHVPSGVERQRASITTLLSSKPSEEPVLGGVWDRFPHYGVRRDHSGEQQCW